MRKRSRCYTLPRPNAGKTKRIPQTALAAAREKGKLMAIPRFSLEQASMPTPTPRAGRFQRLGLIAAFSAFLLPPAAALAAADAVSGRYGVLRDDKDTGCMLTLMGGGRAQLAPACRDNGIVVFDPVRWSIDRGKLVLVARKGHKAHFEKDSNGFWRRDPSEAKSALAFKPI
jgi:hypothetical protein